MFPQLRPTADARQPAAGKQAGMNLVNPAHSDYHSYLLRLWWDAAQNVWHASLHGNGPDLPLFERGGAGCLSRRAARARRGLHHLKSAGVIAETDE